MSKLSKERKYTIERSHKITLHVLPMAWRTDLRLFRFFTSVLTPSGSPGRWTDMFASTLNIPSTSYHSCVTIKFMNLVPRNSHLYQTFTFTIQTSLNLSHNQLNNNSKWKYEEWLWAVADKNVPTAITWCDVSITQIRNHSNTLHAVTGRKQESILY